VNRANWADRLWEEGHRRVWFLLVLRHGLLLFGAVPGAVLCWLPDFRFQKEKDCRVGSPFPLYLSLQGRGWGAREIGGCGGTLVLQRYT
jgi:hypothetical protein